MENSEGIITSDTFCCLWYCTTCQQVLAFKIRPSFTNDQNSLMETVVYLSCILSWRRDSFFFSFFFIIYLECSGKNINIFFLLLRLSLLMYFYLSIFRGKKETDIEVVYKEEHYLPPCIPQSVTWIPPVMWYTRGSQYLFKTYVLSLTSHIRFSPYIKLYKRTWWEWPFVHYVYVHEHMSGNEKLDRPKLVQSGAERIKKYIYEPAFYQTFAFNAKWWWGWVELM